MATARTGDRADAVLRERVAGLAEPIVAGVGAELVEVDVRGQRGSRLVRIVVDADDGIDVDRLADLSRDLGAALDEQDVVAGRYTLEVTSPGVDRPLRQARDFRRNVGRTVRIARGAAAVARGEVGEVSGTVIAADDASVTVEVDGEAVTVPLQDVDHGRVLLPW